MEQLTLRTEDGHKLVARCYRPADVAVAVRRVVIIGPALGVPQTFYERYASWLADHGCAVYTLDWRGMGLSAPPDLRTYRAKLIDWPLQDAPAIMKHAVSQHPGLPVSWFGHSMGGILYGLMPQLPEVDHVVTLGSGSGHVSMLARPLRYGILLFWHVVVPLSVARHGYFAGKRLHMVADLPRGIVSQWKRWSACPDFACAEGPHVREAYARVTHPITAVLFADDKMAHRRGVEAIHRLYTAARVRYLHLHPKDVGVASVGHFNFFHTRTGPKAWAHSLSWLGVSPQPIAEG